MLEFVPLAIVLVLSGAVIINPLLPQFRRTVSRIALLFFGDEPGYRDPSSTVLHQAHISTPYRLYTARTRFYATVAGITGAVIGVYLGAFVRTVVPIFEVVSDGLPPGLEVLGLVTRTLPDLSDPGDVAALETFAVLTVSSVVFGLLGSTLVYGLRRNLPRSRAEARRRDIDVNIPRMVAFTYALSRGGMAFPAVLRALARNEGIFGEASVEATTAVRNIDLFGRDDVSALRQLAERTPSDSMRTFLENLTSVLQSGQNLPSFLGAQYDRYRAEAEERQEEILGQLSTLAEVYVTVVVAGILFLITILLIIGLTTGETLTLMALVTYGALPLLNLIFVTYLRDVTSSLRVRRTDLELDDHETTRSGHPSTPIRTDGGLSATALQNRERLAAYRSFQHFRKVVTQPFRAIIDRPYRILYVSLPIAAGYVAYELVPEFIVTGTVDVAAADDVVILGAIFALASYALVYERSKRRLDRLEEALPELLDRLASLNEAGQTIVQSFDRVRRNDIGAMDAEMDRIWRDIQWGATVQDALYRFERRVRTAAVSRVVTLITASMDASNDTGPVLRIAAEQARRDRRFKRSRRQEMFTYLVAIYVSFLVFIVVIVAIDAFFIPRLLEATTATQGDGLPGTTATFGGFTSLTPALIAQYRLVFFHAALVQALLSGLVGGLMGEGNLRDGVKHAAAMLTITFLVFEFVSVLL